MKRADTKTDCLFVEAQTNSEWDNCEFAILEITPEWLMMMKERFERVCACKGDDTLAEHIYWGMPGDFYSHFDGTPKDLPLREGESSAFVCLEEGEREKLILPENTLRTFQTVVFPDGRVCFRAYGKHTGEEFFTDFLDLDGIIKEG